MNRQVTEVISLLDFLKVIWRGKWIVLCAGVLGVGIGYGGSYLITPTYRAFVVAMPLSQDGAAGGGSGLLGQLGGLAAIAGINVGSGATQEEAIEVLKSRKLISDYIKEKQLLPVLFSEDWDPDAKSWKVKNKEAIPTIQDGYRKFDNDIRSTSLDRNTGIITLSIDWIDGDDAATWANELIARANQEVRNRAINEAEQSLRYLDQELEKNSTVEIRQAIYRMIEEQVKAVTLANVRKEFSFRVIDPAVVPDTDYPTSPKRALIAIVLGALFGIIVSVILWFRHEPLQ